LGSEGEGQGEGTGKKAPPVLESDSRFVKRKSAKGRKKICGGGAKTKERQRNKRGAQGGKYWVERKESVCRGICEKDRGGIGGGGCTLMS